MVWATRSKPRCEIEFHTPTAFYSAEATNSNDPSDDLISVSTNKSLSDTAGSWSVTLTYRNFGTNSAPETWYDRLNPMDAVVIKMGRPPATLDTVMVGLVDEVRRTRSIGADGSPQRQVTINGRDFGKVFLKAVVQFFPQIADGTLPLEMLDGDDTLLGLRTFFLSEEFEYGSAAELIYKGITKILYNLMSFETTTYDSVNRKPVKTTLQEILRFRLCRTSSIQPFINTLADYEGALWNFFESSVNKPFFEFFVDTRPNTELQAMVPPSITERDSRGLGKYEKTWGDDSAKVALVLRPTPFDKGNWDSLVTTEFTDSDIIEEDLGKSDHENQNMWRVQPTVHLLGSEVYDHEVAPELNLSNIKRYGISFYQPDLLGLLTSGDEDDWADLVEYGNNLSKKLKEWYWRNIWFENGTMILPGNGKIKIGQRVRNSEEYHNHIYYVEGVSQEFVNNQRWTTSLTVTRGQDYTGPTANALVSIPTEIKTYGSTAVSAVKTTAQQAANTASATQTHIVKGKDTLWTICNFYYKKVNQALIDKIVAANPQIKDPNKIYVGQKIKIPPL